MTAQASCTMPRKFLGSIPADDHATKIMKPGEQALDFPAAAVAAQYAAILRGLPAACGVVEQLTAHRSVHESAHPADRCRKRDRRSSAREFPRGSVAGAWVRRVLFHGRSAGHVYGERKTMAVADRHDFAAFAAASRADSRAPFFAELKVASMNDSLRSSFPRSRSLPPVSAAAG